MRSNVLLGSGVEVLVEVGVVNASLLVLEPLSQKSSGVDLTKAEHAGGIAAAGFLQAHCGLRGEVQRRVGRTASASFGEVVSHVDVRISPELSLNSIERLVLLLKLAAILEVVERAARNSLIDATLLPAVQSVNDDLFLSKTLLEAVVDSRVDVNVPHGAAIHHDVALEMLRHKGAWN